MPGDIDRSVSGSLRLASSRRTTSYGDYHRLTLQDVEDWCIEARVYGASPTADVDIYHAAGGRDSITVAIPARHDFLPEVPNPGTNARLNRRLVWVAAVAVMLCAGMTVALAVFVLI